MIIPLFDHMTGVFLHQLINLFYVFTGSHHIFCKKISKKCVETGNRDFCHDLNFRFGKIDQNNLSESIFPKNLYIHRQSPIFFKLLAKQHFSLKYNKYGIFLLFLDTLSPLWSQH